MCSDQGKERISVANNTVTVSGSKVKINGRTLTVFNQHKQTGAYAKDISKNGCGACCTAYALILRGKKVTPADVIRKGISLWGKWPRACQISAQGIATILKKNGCEAKYHAVTTKNKADIKRTIHTALMAGKQVICWTDDNDYKGDPFSANEYYVMAVGYNAKGKIVVANPGNRGPVNLVTLDTLCRFLQEGNGKDKKWWQSVAASAGIVVVGSNPKKETTKKTTVVTTTAPPKAPAKDMAELTYGSTGQQVKVLQKLLGNLDVDGIWGPQTNAVVLGFQKRFGLDVDGIVGPLTWNKLLV